MKIRSLPTFLTLSAAALLNSPVPAAEPTPPVGHSRPLFDGKTLAGWEGNPKLWRIEAGALTGGSLSETVPQNEFLASTGDYTNFIVRLKIKLSGTNGFINSGVQMRSQRVPGSSEMSGFQCDYGDPNWWGAVYDESRRNKVMSPSDMAAIGPAINRGDWNDYVIRADGARITTWLNGVEATDYIEQDPDIPEFGKFGIQIHGGGKALVQVKDITLEELPVRPAFVGAAELRPFAGTEPLSPEEEQRTFTLPPGFDIELIARESEGIGKFVTVDWDQQGRMWSMTALEYPVDANESPEVAKALYASRARDKVLVWDHPFEKGLLPQPRVFTDGLAIPLGILPYKNGVYVQHGPDIEFRSDTDGDGKADKTEILLSGFGVQDSHLFPHQFTRAPGNWIWMAQGAFNYGKVRTAKGKEQQFDQTRMARFRYDGSDFDITSQGPCNIWGLVLTAEGEAFIQEANDYGYPMMPFDAYANYPGCSDAQFKSYAPEFPGTAPDFQMGGTGLSGLALSDAHHAWPDPYANVFYLANPITRKIQCIQLIRVGPRYRLQKLPDFIKSSDEMFRPVSVHFGPDGRLYIVDWYNKIISHNEVPRNHPDRDKKRGRIWHVTHRSQKPFPVPDFTRLGVTELLAKLGGDSLAQSHLAWQAIVDRNLTGTAPQLKSLIADSSLPTGKRVASLWALEGLRLVDLPTLTGMLRDPDRNIRREGARAFGEAGIDAAQAIRALEPLAGDPDPQVRAEIIRTAGKFVEKNQDAVALCLKFARPALDGPIGRSTSNGRPIKILEAYEREFERYLARLFLEQHPEQTAAFLNSPAAEQLPAENRILGALALEPKSSALEVARLLPKLGRPPNQEEMLRLLTQPAKAGVQQAVAEALRDPALSEKVVEGALQVKSRFDTSPWENLFTEVTRNFWRQDHKPMALRMASGFKLSAFEQDLLEPLRSGKSSPDEQLAVLRALREVGTTEAALLASIATNSGNTGVRNEALSALTISRGESAPELIIGLWPELNAIQRRTALDRLIGTKAAALQLVEAVKTGRFPNRDLDRLSLERLVVVLPGNPDVTALTERLTALFRPVLHLDGNDDSWIDSKITLEPAFTVETWVKLAPGIDNNDGILGAPGALDLNFYDSHFRVWLGGGLNDVAIAKKAMAPESWTHIAVTRSPRGKIKIYINGELDTESAQAVTNHFENLRIGWSGPPRGTEGDLTEFRVWNRERTADEIRNAFDRSLDEQSKPPELSYYFTGSKWENLHGNARVVKTDDFPLLLTAVEAMAQDAKFDKFRQLAGQPGDVAHGKQLFTVTCMICHTVAGQGAQIGPVLNGAGAMGTEALLRAILTPNAAMEAGYRAFRVELKGGDVLDGLLVSQDKEAIILRQPNREDQRILQEKVMRAGYTKTSIMPEGLLDAMPAPDVTDLFTYLKTLK